MDHCTNHPNRKAYSICHNCGKPFCEECLTAGGEYYYCSNPECIKHLPKEERTNYLSEVIKCPNCSNEIKLNKEERSARKFHCPRCEAFLDYTSEPPKIFLPDKFTKLLSTMNQGDIALIKSILENQEIDYYVSGENFARLDPLIQPAFFYVANSKIEQAKEALKEIDVHIFGVSAIR